MKRTTSRFKFCSASGAVPIASSINRELDPLRIELDLSGLSLRFR
jgi:hypothetical protein